jgi:hypothetical protein
MFAGRNFRLGFLGISLAFVACSGDGGGSDEDGVGADEGVDSQGNTDFTCCINDVGYTCPDKSAFDQCLGFDIQECTMACSFGDSACNSACFDQWSASKPNPDECEVDAEADCSTSSGTCSGTGIPCDLNQDCCEGLVCAPRDDGQPGGSCQ